MRKATRPGFGTRAAFAGFATIVVGAVVLLALPAEAQTSGGGGGVGTGQSTGGAGGSSSVTIEPSASSGNSGGAIASSSSTNTGNTGSATAEALTAPVAATGASGPTGATGDQVSSPTVTNTVILGTSTATSGGAGALSAALGISILSAPAAASPAAEPATAGTAPSWVTAYGPTTGEAVSPVPLEAERAMVPERNSSGLRGVPAAFARAASGAASGQTSTVVIAVAAFAILYTARLRLN